MAGFFCFCVGQFLVTSHASSLSFYSSSSQKILILESGRAPSETSSSFEPFWGASMSFCSSILAWASPDPMGGGQGPQQPFFRRADFFQPGGWTPPPPGGGSLRKALLPPSNQPPPSPQPTGRRPHPRPHAAPLSDGGHLHRDAVPRAVVLRRHRHGCAASPNESGQRGGGDGCRAVKGFFVPPGLKAQLALRFTVIFLPPRNCPPSCSLAAANTGGGGAGESTSMGRRHFYGFNPPSQSQDAI